MGPYNTVVAPEVLRQHLDDRQWVVLDCRHNLQDFAAGRRAYEAGHIPGAFFADVEGDLAGEKSGKNGRHPLPDPQQFSDFLRSLGVDDATQIVAYDEGADMYAARCWFLCRWIGHDAVAILDGGLAAWRALDCPLTTCHPERSDHSEWSRRSGNTLTLDLHPELLVNVGDVLANLRSERMTLLDARAGERFRGETEPVDPIAGHIPGARNRSFKENFDERRRLKSPERLREEYRAFGEPGAVVHQCGSGISSAVNALAMEHAGLRGWRLYPGSWSEWVADPSRPVETGPASA